MNSSDPQVSVVIPFYNRADWLAEAVRSVLDQTYRDFEVIVVDDGSEEPVPPGLALDPRVRYVRQENRGAAAARNRGVELARGRFVALLDADDLFTPTKLERQMAYMEAHRDVLLTHTSYRRMTAAGEDLEVVHSGEFSGRLGGEVLLSCGIATPTVMIRRDALGADMRFEEAVRVGEGEDIIFWLRFATKFKIVGLDEPLTRVRMHGRNVSLDPDAQRIAARNVIEYVVERNPDFASSLPRRVRSSVYLRASRFHLDNGDRTNYLAYLKRALVTWPFNLEAYRTAGRHVAYKLRAEARRRGGSNS